MENRFYIFGQKGGYNRNPTVKMFQASFKIDSVIQLMKPPVTSNCEPDEDYNIFQYSQYPLAEKPNEDIQIDETILNASSNRPNASKPQVILETTLEDCSRIYFVGYLAKKCIEKFLCENCMVSLTINSKLEKK